MHIRRLVTANIGEELNKERRLASLMIDLQLMPDLPFIVSNEELAKCLGINQISLDRYLPRNS